MLLPLPLPLLLLNLPSGLFSAVTFYQPTLPKGNIAEIVVGVSLLGGRGRASECKDRSAGNLKRQSRVRNGEWRMKSVRNYFESGSSPSFFFFEKTKLKIKLSINYVIFKFF